MLEFSIWHWLILFAVLLLMISPILGVARGVANGSVVHAVASVLLPVYGLVYFLAARRPRK
jgi:hypothetical protein